MNEKQALIDVNINDKGKFIILSSPASKKKFRIFFQPSKYLDSENDLRKLVSILGESQFEKELGQNHLTVNETFILKSFSNSGQYFFIDETNKKIFASLNQRIESKYGNYPKSVWLQL